eukprot:15323902-Ditylum_brightwellii.AAC.1
MLKMTKCVPPSIPTPKLLSDRHSCANFGLSIFAMVAEMQCQRPVPVPMGQYSSSRHVLVVKMSMTFHTIPSKVSAPIELPASASPWAASSDGMGLAETFADFYPGVNDLTL